MNENQPWEFTCSTCGGHKLNVYRTWNILSGTDSETWQEWGPLEANHVWRFEFKEQMEEDNDTEVERGDFSEFAEDDSDSEPEEYEIVNGKSEPESDQFYVNCAGCDREIEFGWSKPNRGGDIFPVECSDFIPGKFWPSRDIWIPGSEKAGSKSEVSMSENKNVTEIHGCVVCAKLFNILVVYTPEGKLLDCTVTSPGGHIVPDKRRPLVACDSHKVAEIESAQNKRQSTSAKKSDHEQEED